MGRIKLWFNHKLAIAVGWINVENYQINLVGRKNNITIHPYIISNIYIENVYIFNIKFQTNYDDYKPKFRIILFLKLTFIHQKKN